MADYRTGDRAATHAQHSEKTRVEMESWLLDVKRVRIPRPKFQTGVGALRYPAEPPKDYYISEEAEKAKRELAKATEELRRAVQDKL